MAASEPGPMPGKGFYKSPVGCVYEVTYRCDNRCEFCYAPLSQSEVARELDVHSVVRSLIDQGLFHIGFSGGEPLLRPEVVDAALVARRERVRTTLITNGTQIPRVGAARLMEAFNDIQVSLQGPTPEDHDAITGVTGSFQRALAGIEALVAEGASFNVNATLTTRNADSLPALMDLVRTLGGRSFSVTRFCVPSGGDTGGLSLPPKVFRAIIARCLAHGEAIGVTFAGILSGIPLCSLGSLILRHRGLAKGCTCGRYWVDITPWGGVKTCPPAFEEHGRFDDLAGLWRTDFIRRWQADEFLPQPCRRCKLVWTCRGGCRSAAHHESGLMDAPDPLYPPWAAGGGALSPRVGRSGT